jgi:hypothetical protein
VADATGEVTSTANLSPHLAIRYDPKILSQTLDAEHRKDGQEERKRMQATSGTGMAGPIRCNINAATSPNA